MPFYKRMAIIGGLGPHAGAYALQSLLGQAAQDYDAYQDHEYPDVIHHSVPFKGSNTTGVEDASSVVQQAQNCLRRLRHCDVELALLACNSSHAFLDKIRTGTEIEIVSLIEAASHQIEAHPARRFGILASQSTRQAGLYEKILADHGRTIIDPGENFQQQVNDLIANAMHAKISPACLEMFGDIVDQLHSKGAEAIILGCTEISRLKEFSRLSVPAIDSLEAATRIMLKKSWKPGL